MKYTIVACDILACLCFAGAALTADNQSNMIMNAACSLMWAVTTVLNVATCFKKEK